MAFWLLRFTNFYTSSLSLGCCIPPFNDCSFYCQTLNDGVHYSRDNQPRILEIFILKHSWVEIRMFKWEWEGYKEKGGESIRKGCCMCHKLKKTRGQRKIHWVILVIGIKWKVGDIFLHQKSKWWGTLLLVAHFLFFIIIINNYMRE